MKIDDLIILAENRLMALNNATASAVTIGDVEAITKLESEVFDTQQTLNKLRSSGLLT